ncbi:MAG: ATP synthase F1 subunit delta [bacterium]
MSRRYAKALFQLALENRKEEEVDRELERFLAAYGTASLSTVLNHPAFGMANRKKILLQVAEGLQASPLVRHFLSLLLERDRLAYLASIAAHYRRLLYEAKGKLEAEVVSVSPLGEAMVERLQTVLHGISGKEVILHARTDPGLLGGLVIQMEGKVYDGSVRTQLQKMTERIGRGY